MIRLLFLFAPWLFSADSLPPVSTEALSASLRELLLKHLPDPLYEDRRDWGETDRVFSGLRWKKKGLVVRKSEKNDGRWKKTRLDAVNLAQNLVLKIANIQHPDPARTRFDVFLSFPARVDYRQQNWESGVKWFDIHARARFRARLSLVCESTSRLEKDPGSSLPALVFRVNVVKADLKVDRFEMEHVAGLDGDAAEIVGRAIRETVQEIRPRLEGKFLAKANAAIEKAADTKEIRLGLSALAGPKSKPLKPAEKKD